MLSTDTTRAKNEAFPRAIPLSLTQKRLWDGKVASKQHGTSGMVPIPLELVWDQAVWPPHSPPGSVFGGCRARRWLASPNCYGNSMRRRCFPPPMTHGFSKGEVVPRPPLF